MCSLFIFGFLLCGYGDAATFDQRQTGELNVQLDLKDLHVFAIMKGDKEDYVDYDYAYDYSEMTIKPPNGTTSKPLNVTSAPVTVKENTTIAIEVTNIVETTESILANNSSHQIAETTNTPLNSTPNNDSTEANLNDSITSTTVALLNDTTLHPNATINCKKGFIRNDKGNCELKLQGASNALLKIVKLSQRLKLRREKTKIESDSL